MVNLRCSKIEIIIAKIYIYMLPIRMIAQFSFIQSALKGAAYYFDFIIHILGIIIFIINRRGVIQLEKDDVSILLRRFFILIFYLNSSSLIMACIIQIIYGNYAGETAFSGIMGMCIYFFQYALMLFYNKHVFELITKEELERIFGKLIFFLMIIGYWQIAVMTFGGITEKIYNRIDILGILADVNKVGKLCLTTTEGASAGTLISAFVFPYLYSCILKKKNAFKYVIQIILWIPILFFTKSSTAYILFAIEFLVAAVFLLKERKTSKVMITIIFIGAIFLLGAFILPDYFIGFLPESIRKDVYYMLFKKAIDLSNGSTVSRIVPLLINWGAFKEYPILGVGNGLQGYFYQKYFPSWGYTVRGSDILSFLETAKNTIANGAVFIPSLLSGYGIVGVALIISWVKRYISLAIRSKEQMGIFYYMFIFATISMFISGFQGEFCGKYYIWFMFSLPLMVREDDVITKGFGGGNDE